jgi:hypothetical protein
MVGEWRLRLALELMSLWRYVELAARFDPLGPDLRRDDGIDRSHLVTPIKIGAQGVDGWRVAFAVSFGAHEPVALR